MDSKEFILIMHKDRGVMFEALGLTFFCRRKILGYTRARLTSVSGINHRTIERLEQAQSSASAYTLLILTLMLWPSVDMMIDDVVKTYDRLKAENASNGK